ncbi:MAG: hypothetical protein HUJ88_12890 [Fusobacterium necrophorum]|nr:hypothetical protein [Fusobacterium necrophorum]
MIGKEINKEKKKRIHLFDENTNISSFLEEDIHGNYIGNQTLFNKETGNLILNRFVDENGNARATYYSDNNVIQKCNEKLVNGDFLKHGSFERYSEDGKVVELGQYNNGQKDGKWIYVDKDSKKIEVKKYKNGKDITSEEEKEAAKQLMNSVGDFIDAFEERSIGRALQKLVRNVSSLSELFIKDKNSFPQIKTNFEQEPTLKIGESEMGYSTFYPDGSIKKFVEKATLLETKKVKYEGRYLEHYDEGGVKIIANYNHNGNLDGIYKEYYTNGKVKLEGKYLDGEKVGIFTSYNKKEEKVEEKKYEIYREGKVSLSAKQQETVKENIERSKKMINKQNEKKITKEKKKSSNLRKKIKLTVDSNGRER